MRKKHWGGYGSVNVKVCSNSLDTSTGVSTVKIEIWGNHELGLVPYCHDEYLIAEWLGKIGKFNYNTILDYTTQEWIQEKDHECEDHCYYNIQFKNCFYKE